MWYAAYLIKCAAGPRRPVAALAGPRPKSNIPADVQARAREGQAAFAAARNPRAAAGMNPALRNALLIGAVGAGGLGVGYGLNKLLGLNKALMPDGSHTLPGSTPEANDPAARINKEMEEKRKAVQMTPAVQ
jgi:hypothetical protein